MAELTISNARLREGVWQGLLVAPQGNASLPEIEVLHLGEALENVRLHADAEMANVWTLSVPIPMAFICDGVQSFLVKEKSSGRTLASFAIAAGAALDEDLQAEVEFLRTELNLLKRAFRRHCLETAQ
ncbi:hypothetical protein R3X27_01440 [Tropicimonas sp. TH_r6]|uniref:hypothetical protein n=1 Tax=Tropicimonas sp. TH_r6 TaxID=3082085 RepID=UPI002953332A|nr:hypothetical protein [Tropicimonas sp. TH_r6]MDV7141337.1 hypothetical protein [Tropicimonas sp. TH_r6]